MVPLIGWVAWQAFLVIRVSWELLPIWWLVIAGLGLPSCLVCLVLVGLRGSLATRFAGQALVCLLWLPVTAIWIGLPTDGNEWAEVLLPLASLGLMLQSLAKTRGPREAIPVLDS